MTEALPQNLKLHRRHLLGTAGVAAAVAVVPEAGARQATPESTDMADTIAALEAYVTDLMERTGVPGVGIAIVHEDEVVHLGGYGVREIGKPELIDADTVFQLASVSKGMAATTVAAVVGDGQASWDDSVHELYPEFELSEPWTTHAVTVRDLFSHRSGLPEHAGDLLEDLGFPLEEIIHRLRFIEPEGPFRASYFYTNFGLSAAAYGVARSAGMSWADLAQTRFYDRLGMASTSSRFDDYMAQENRAIPHAEVEPGVFAFVEQRQPDAQTPAGGVSSNVRDMAQYLRLLLGGGTVDGEEIVDRDALGETFIPHSPTGRVADPATQRTGFYGLGWNVGQSPQGQPTFSHSGGFALGAATVVNFNPSNQIGIVVLTNGSPIGGAEAIAFSFMDLFEHGEILHDYATLLRPIVDEQLAYPYDRGIDFSVQPVDFTDPAPLDRYAGEYASDLWGVAGVTVNGDELVLELGPDRTSYPMTHYSGDIFRFTPPGENGGPPSLVTFTIGPNALANRVTIDYLDREGQGTLLRTLNGD
ncbi:MAG: serine hydrolase [Thermomicrobiales bacterium]